MTLAQRTFAEVEIRRARRGDPDTSHAAAAASHGLAAEHRLLIVQSLRDAGRDLAAHEIAGLCGLSSVQVSRRLRELVDDGEIVVTPNTKPTPAGRPSHTYEVRA